MELNKIALLLLLLLLLLLSLLKLMTFYFLPMQIHRFIIGCGKSANGY